MQRLLKVDFVRFCLVGFLGFLINFALLTLFFKVFRSPLFISQIVAAEIALFSNFLFHHHWTYKASHTRKAISKLIIQFHVTSWVAIIGSAVIVSIGVHALHLAYGVALMFAAGAALIWNFGWSRFVIWRRPQDDQDKTEEAT